MEAKSSRKRLEGVDTIVVLKDEPVEKTNDTREEMPEDVDDEDHVDEGDDVLPTTEEPNSRSRRLKLKSCLHLSDLRRRMVLAEALAQHVGDLADGRHRLHRADDRRQEVRRCPRRRRRAPCSARACSAALRARAAPRTRAT